MTLVGRALGCSEPSTLLRSVDVDDSDFCEKQVTRGDPPYSIQRFCDSVFRMLMTLCCRQSVQNTKELYIRRIMWMGVVFRVRKLCHAADEPSELDADQGFDAGQSLPLGV